MWSGRMGVEARRPSDVCVRMLGEVTVVRLWCTLRERERRAGDRQTRECFGAARKRVVLRSGTWTAVSATGSRREVPHSPSQTTNGWGLIVARTRVAMGKGRVGVREIVAGRWRLFRIC